MSTTRDENSRAGAYISSDKPLFNRPRNTEGKRFTKDVRTRKDQELLSSEGSPASRIPTRINSPPKPAITLKAAWEKALKEEEDAVAKANRSVEDAVREGSPSPAPRARGIAGETQREKDESRMRRLREGMAVAPVTRLAQNGVNAAEQSLEDGNTIRTNGSGSGGSLSGSWTGVGEDATDEDLERKMKQYDRDQKRAAVALGNQKGLFSKGNVGTRVTETAQRLARRGSGSSIENEPGVRIPNTWGRKARPTSGWMNRILSPDSHDGAQKLPPRIQPEGPVDWVGAAVNVPLPSVEDDSMTQEPTPPQSRPSSAQPITKSTETSQIWDADLEFTARSLQISTSPQLNIRNTKLNEIRLREIESLSKRAVATSRLEEIRERNSEERSVSPEATRKSSKESLSSRHISEDADYGADLRQSPLAKTKGIVDKEAPNKSYLTERVGERTNLLLDENSAIGDHLVVTSSGLTEDKQLELEPDKVATEKLPKITSLNVPGEEYSYEKTVLEEEGEPIAGTPITIFSGSAERKRDLRTGHKREDSWNTLRKLSKVASTSPSPASAKTIEQPMVEAAKHSRGPTINVGKTSEVTMKHLDRLTSTTNSKRNSTASSPPKSDVDPEERIAAEASLFELPPADNKSERNSVRYPSPERDTDVEETPRPKPDPLSLLTPVVTGAYIDTPAPRGRVSKIQRPGSPPSDADDALYDEVSRLALKDFLRDNSSRSSTKDVIGGRLSGDRPGPLSSHPTRRPSKPRPRLRSRPPLVNTANPASVEEDLRRLRQEAQIEDSTLDDFDELLAAEADESDPNSTTVIIPSPIDLERDEKGRSLSEKERDRRQEMLVYERMNKTVKSSLRNIRDAKRGIERIEDRVNSTPAPLPHTHNHVECAACASPTSIYHLNIPLPRLWYRDLTKWNGIRFTWLGFMLALLFTWIISESITCEYICHPKYAIRNEWHPSDPFWGWALPTLINRSTGGWLRVLVTASWRLLVWMWGSWTGASFSDWGPTVGSGPRHQASTLPHGAGSWSEGSMFEDEAI